MRISSIPCLAGLTLAAACHGATAAEWTQLPHPASSGLALYADPATEQLKHSALVGFFLGNPVQAWFVTDYASAHRLGVQQVLSSKQLLELDCKNAGTRLLTRLYYDGPMAQGRIVASEPEARSSTRVVPGDPEESMLHSACARAKAQAQAPTGATAAAPSNAVPAPPAPQ